MIKIKRGYVAMNKGEFNDLENMTFLNTKKETKGWERDGQKILRVEIKFLEAQR